MSPYLQRVADNILPLSTSKMLSAAFQEWFFTEKVKDHERAVKDCELCDREKLRYHFEIQNRHTQKRLWVGSSCILKFKVQVFENGILLDEIESARKLDNLTQKMRLESCITALKKLAVSEKDEKLSNALKFYIKNKHLTPKQANLVLWRLDENQIDHSPTFFKVSIKKEQYKTDLADMESFKVHRIWPALSSSQRKVALSYGHTPPRKPYN